MDREHGLTAPNIKQIEAYIAEWESSAGDTPAASTPASKSGYKSHACLKKLGHTDCSGAAEDGEGCDPVRGRWARKTAEHSSIVIEGREYIGSEETISKLRACINPPAKATKSKASGEYTIGDAAVNDALLRALFNNTLSAKHAHIVAKNLFVNLDKKSGEGFSGSTPIAGYKVVDDGVIRLQSSSSEKLAYIHAKLRELRGDAIDEEDLGGLNDVPVVPSSSSRPQPTPSSSSRPKTPPPSSQLDRELAEKRAEVMASTPPEVQAAVSDVLNKLEECLRNRAN